MYKSDLKDELRAEVSEPELLDTIELDVTQSQQQGFIGAYLPEIIQDKTERREMIARLCESGLLNIADGHIIAYGWMEEAEVFG